MKSFDEEEDALFCVPKDCLEGHLQNNLHNQIDD